MQMLVGSCTTVLGEVSPRWESSEVLLQRLSGLSPAKAPDLWSTGGLRLASLPSHVLPWPANDWLSSMGMTLG